MPALATQLNPRSEDFKANAAAMRLLVEDLNAKLARIAEGGGADARAKHLARGKLLPRDRVERLLDPGTPFLEIAPLAALGMYPEKGGQDAAPGAGMIAGIGRVAGVECLIVCNDATVKGGTYYPITVKKHLRAQEIARGECRLVVEDAAEIIAVGKHLILRRQERTAAFHEVNARQLIVAGDLLGTQVFLNGDRIVGAALHRGIVRHHHALAPGDAANAGDDAGAGDVAAVHAVGGELRELEKGAAGVEQHADALARRELARRLVLFRGGTRAAPGDARHLGMQIADQGTQRALVFAVFL